MKIITDWLRVWLKESSVVKMVLVVLLLNACSLMMGQIIVEVWCDYEIILSIYILLLSSSNTGPTHVGGSITVYLHGCVQCFCCKLY